MKKFSFVMAILAVALVFSLALASCGGDEGSNNTPGGNTPGGNSPGGNQPSGGSSTLTVTGIPPQYNGKYAYTQGECASGVHFASGGQNVILTGIITLDPISNGRASLSLLRQDNLFPYSGTELAHVYVMIYDQGTLPNGIIADRTAAVQFTSVPFTNGSATVNWANGF